MSEATTEDTPKTQTFRDDLQRLQFTELEKQIVARNDLVGRANAASGDRVTLTEQMRENDTDPEVVEAREQMSKWALRLDELIKPKVDAIIADSKGSVEELEKAIKEADSLVNPGVNFYKKMYGDEAASFFTERKRLKGTAVRSGGSGGRRIRGFNVTVQLEDKDAVTFDNFSGAAKYIGVETSDLQNAFFAKAGTEDVAKIDDEVTYTVNYTNTDGEGNKTEHAAYVTAERTEEAKAKRNEAAASNAAPAADEDDDEPESNDESDESGSDEDDLSDAL